MAKTMLKRMMDATDRLIMHERPYDDKYHDLEKGMAVYERKASTLFCHVIKVDEWHDMTTAERREIEHYMFDYMMNQDELHLGAMTIALAEFIVKDGDKALVRIEYNR
jgi:hypothetical protein